MPSGKFVISVVATTAFLFAAMVTASFAIHSPRTLGKVFTPNAVNTEEVIVDDFIPMAAETNEHVTEYPLDVDKLSLDSSKTFYRDHLDKHARDAYDVLKAGLQSFEEEIEIPKDATKDEVKRILLSIAYDNPTMFWFLPSGTIVYYEQPMFRPDYTMSKDEAKELENQIAAIFDETAASIAEQAPYDRALKRQMVVSWIADRCAYDAEAPNGRNVLGVVFDGNAYCAGYARTEVALLRLLGTPCVYVEGMAWSSGAETRHAWVLVVEGRELTWDDPTWYDVDKDQLPARYEEKWLASTWYDFADTHWAVDASDIIEEEKPES